MLFSKLFFTKYKNKCCHRKIIYKYEPHQFPLMIHHFPNETDDNLDLILLNLFEVAEIKNRKKLLLYKVVLWKMFFCLLCSLKLISFSLYTLTFCITSMLYSC